MVANGIGGAQRGRGLDLDFRDPAAHIPWHRKFDNTVRALGGDIASFSKRATGTVRRPQPCGNGSFAPPRFTVSGRRITMLTGVALAQLSLSRRLAHLGESAGWAPPPPTSGR